MRLADLEAEIEALSAAADPEPDRAIMAVEELFSLLEQGEVRAATQAADGTWTVHAWVKRGILIAFRLRQNVSVDVAPFHFRDRASLGTWNVGASGREVRVVPGGTTIRRGVYLADGVVVMPPAYVNVGAWVGPGSMVDSHALVGSCAQIGRRVHLSAAVQIGGVLEPAGALPVIVEDDAFVGGGAGVYEGVRVGSRAVLAPGVVLTRSIPCYDLVRDRVLRAGADGVLSIPAGAVVVPGSRPAAGAMAERLRLSVYAPMVIKYRDDGTSAAVALEEVLR